MTAENRPPAWSPIPSESRAGETTMVLPETPVRGYTAGDFPAPAGVPPVGGNPPAPAGGKPRRRAGAFLAAAFLSAAVGAGAGVGTYAYLSPDNAATSPISVSTLPAAQSPKLDGTVAAAAAKIDPSLVTITVQNGRGGIGSGVIIDTEGHILTNAHVVEGGSGSVTVIFDDGSTAQARIVGTSESNDLAVIKVDGVDNLTPATFAKSSLLQVGQTVVAAGAPLGLTESVTSGIVSNTARPVRSGSTNDAVYLAVQTDAAINPGNSGGPLVDLNGAIVGINSSIATTGSNEGQSGNIGIGFAVPSDVAVRVAADLIDHGSSANAALGVTVSGTDVRLSTATGVPLESVVTGGAADKAGLRVGDVITKVNDFETRTGDGLIAATRYYAPGTTVKITFIRDGGSPQTVDVTLGTA